MQQQKMNMSKKKLRIGDLAKELRIKKYVIRFWEKEFDLKSDRSQGGQRFYTQKDLDTFVKIKTLLYEQGFTISGAKKQLKSSKSDINKKQEEKTIIAATKEVTLDEKKHKAFMKDLCAFKKQLLDIKKQLEG